LLWRSYCGLQTWRDGGDERAQERRRRGHALLREEFEGGRHRCRELRHVVVVAIARLGYISGPPQVEQVIVRDEPHGFFGVSPNQLEVRVALDAKYGVREELAQPQGLLDHPQEEGVLLAGTPKSPSQRLARGAPEQYSRLFQCVG